MASGERIVKFTFIGDSKPAQKSVDEFIGKTDKLSVEVDKAAKGPLAKLSGAFGDVTKIAGGFVLGQGILQAPRALGAIVGAASDVAESQNKVNVVFGESAKTINDFAANSAKSYGIAKGTALEYAGTLGNLFRAMEIGEGASADMSKQLLGLSADLASFNNADPTEVLDALKSGLVGETEPLRRFGVNLSAARVEAEAYALGLAKPTENVEAITAANLKVEKATQALAKAQKEHGKDSLQAREAANQLALAQQGVEKAMEGSKVELTAAQKAQATYSLIMKDTTLAQGDFARTSDGMANSTRIIKAQLQDTAAAIGQRVMPAIEPLIVGFAQRLPGAIDMAIGFFGKIADAVSKPIATAREAVSTFLAYFREGFEDYQDAGPFGILGYHAGNLARVFREEVLPAVIGFAREALPRVQDFAEQARTFFQDVIVPAVSNFAGIIRDDVIPAVQQFVADARPKIEEFATRVQSFFNEVIQPAIRQFVDDVLPRIIEGWNNIRAEVEPTVKALSLYITETVKFIGDRIREHGDEIMAVLRMAWNTIKTIVDTAITIVSETIQLVMNIIQGDWSEAWDNVKAILQAAWDLIVSIGDTMGNALKVLLDMIWDSIVIAAQAYWDRVKDVTRERWDAIKGYIDSTKDALKSALLWPFEQFRDLLGGIMDRAKMAALTPIQEIIDAINGFARSASGVLGKLSIDVDIPTLPNVISRARGGLLESGGLVDRPVVIMGEEAPRHPEYVIPTNPAYRERAMDLWRKSGRALGVAGFAEGGILGRIGGAVDFVRDMPGALSGLVPDIPNIPGLFGQMAGAVAKRFLNAIVEWLRGKIPFFGGGTGTGSVVEGPGNVPGSVTDWLNQAIQITGVDPSWLSGLQIIAMHESGGNPRAINLWDINAINGIPSKGLMQTIDPTFASNMLPGYNDIYNPVHNAIAAIRYIQGRYGSVWNVPGVVAVGQGRPYVGYAEGGIINEPIAGYGWETGRTYLFGERGPEMVVPLTGQGGGLYGSEPVAGEIRITAAGDVRIDPAGAGGGIYGSQRIPGEVRITPNGDVFVPTEAAAGVIGSVYRASRLGPGPEIGQLVEGRGYFTGEAGVFVNSPYPGMSNASVYRGANPLGIPYENHVHVYIDGELVVESVEKAQMQRSRGDVVLGAAY